MLEILSNQYSFEIKVYYRLQVCSEWGIIKYKVDIVRKVGEAKLHISLKIEQCGNVGKVEWAKLAKLGLLFPQILISE